MRKTIAATLVAGSLLGCGMDQETTTALPGALVRDSAEVRIAENPRPPDGSRLPWSIGPEPTVSIGEVEGDDAYLLHWASTSTRLADGRIMVGNRGSEEVRVFDASGTHLFSFGRAGEGPGEFQSLSEVRAWPGDSVAVWYGPRMGISIFDQDGAYGRSFTLQADEREWWLRPWPSATRADGSVISIADPEHADTALVEIWGADGEFSASLGRHLSRPVVVTTDERGLNVLNPVAFGRSLEVEPWGDLVVVSSTDRYELRAYRADGSLARIVRREHQLHSPVAADLEHYIDEQVEAMALYGGDAEGLRAALANTPLAETFPAIGSVRSDALGNLWVREYDLPRQERPRPLWTVFDPEGRVLGFVETPAGVFIRQIGEDYLLGWREDDLGVEYVQLWPLVRSPG